MMTTEQKEKVILDTDIGSDIDDSAALAYLLAQEKCELLGVTTVSGEPVRRAQMVSALLRAAGRGDIPVYPGAALPMLTDVKQAYAPQADRLVNWPHDTDFPMGEYLDFLRSAIRANPHEVTLLAIGPMTNVGLLFAMDLEIPSLLKRLVLMNGSFEHRLAVGYNEWNSLNDPYATAIVYRGKAPVHRSVGLDVTMQVQMRAEEMRARFTHPLLKIVEDFSTVWFEHADIMTFHDPLAAVSIFEPEVCGFARGKVEIELISEKLMGVTHFARDPQGPHEIADTVSPERFFDRYFGVFA